MQQQRIIHHSTDQQSHTPIQVQITTFNKATSNQRTVNFNFGNQPNSTAYRTKPHVNQISIDKEFSFANGTIENSALHMMNNQAQNQQKAQQASSPNRNRVKFADTIESVTAESVLKEGYKTVDKRDEIVSPRVAQASTSKFEKAHLKKDKKVKPSAMLVQLTESKKQAPALPKQQQTVKGRNNPRVIPVSQSVQNETSLTRQMPKKPTTGIAQVTLSSLQQTKLQIPEVNPNKSLCKQVYLNLRRKFNNESDNPSISKKNTILGRSNSEATIEINYNASLNRVTSPVSNRNESATKMNKMKSPFVAVRTEIVDNAQFSTPLPSKIRNSNLVQQEKLLDHNHKRNPSKSGDKKIQIDFRQAQQIDLTPPESSKRDKVNQGPLIVNDYQQLNINTKKMRVEAFTRENQDITMSGERILENYSLLARKYSMTPVQYNEFVQGDPYGSQVKEYCTQREHVLLKLNNNKPMSWEQSRNNSEGEATPSAASRNQSLLSIGKFRRSRKDRKRDISLRQSSTLGSQKDSACDILMNNHININTQQESTDKMQPIELGLVIMQDLETPKEQELRFTPALGTSMQDSQNEIPQPVDFIPSPEVKSDQPEQSVAQSLDVQNLLSQQVKTPEKIEDMKQQQPPVDNPQPLKKISTIESPIKTKKKSNVSTPQKVFTKSPKITRQKSKDKIHQRKSSIQQNSLVILDTSSLKNSIQVNITPNKNIAEGIQTQLIQQFQTSSTYQRAVISKEVNLASDYESGGELTQSSNKEYETTNQLKKSSFVAKTQSPKFKIKRNRINDLKELVQRDMRKGIFDMKAIRRLENEAAIIIQQFIRRRNIKMIKPMREGRNCGVQTDPEPKPKPVDKDKLKTKIVYQFMLMSMALAFKSNKKSKHFQIPMSVIPSTDSELSQSIQVDVFKIRSENYFENSIHDDCTKRVATEESEDFRDSKQKRSAFRNKANKIKVPSQEQLQDRPKQLKKDPSVNSLSSQIQMDQQKQSLRIEKYSNTYALKSIKKSKELQHVK